MKKRRKKIRKIARAKIQSIEPVLANQTQAKSKIPAYRQILKIAGWFLGTPLALLGFVFAVWGPPWATALVFSPGPPSVGAPFDIPFDVENKSALFGFSNLQIACQFQGPVEGPGGAAVAIGPGIAVQRATGKNRLEPLGHGSYACPLRGLLKLDGVDAAELFKTVEITFISTYDRRIFWGRATDRDGPFGLVTTPAPAHWVRGEPLK